MILVRTTAFWQEDYGDSKDSPGDFVLLKRHSFIEFLHREESKELLLHIREATFTSDAWLEMEIPEDEIGWNITISDLEEQLAEGGVDAVLEMLYEKDILEHPYNWGSTGPDYGFILESVILSETDSFMVGTIISQYQSALKKYNNLTKYFN